MQNQKSVLVRVIKGELTGDVGRYIGDYIEGDQKLAVIQFDYQYDVAIAYDHIKFIEN